MPEARPTGKKVPMSEKNVTTGDVRLEIEDARETIHELYKLLADLGAEEIQKGRRYALARRASQAILHLEESLDVIAREAVSHG